MTREGEYAAVKLVGEKIGYGNLMSIAGTLWRRSLRDQGYPESGAFIPTCPSFIDKETFKELGTEVEMMRQDIELDQLIEEGKI